MLSNDKKNNRATKQKIL